MKTSTSVASAKINTRLTGIFLSFCSFRSGTMRLSTNRCYRRTTSRNISSDIMIRSNAFPAAEKSEDNIRLFNYGCIIITKMQCVEYDCRFTFSRPESYSNVVTGSTTSKRGFLIAKFFPIKFKNSFQE
jgi:hypothetical protein